MNTGTILLNGNIDIEYIQYVHNNIIMRTYIDHLTTDYIVLASSSS